jgi:FkbM family methyltransferase
MHQSAFDHISTAFRKHYDPKRHRRALDVGSRSVSEQKLTHRSVIAGTDLQYVGIDLGAGPNVDLVMEQPYVLPIEDDSIDIIFSGQVFEHIPYFWVTFVEMARVLRNGGFILLSAPSRGHQHSHPTDCWRFYPDGMLALAAFTGLELISAHTDFPPRIEGRSHFDYSKISSYRYWGDTVGVFTKTAGYPADEIAPMRKALVDWSNARQLRRPSAPRSTSDLSPASADVSVAEPITYITYPTGPLQVAVRNSVVADVIQNRITGGTYEKGEIALVPQILDDNEVVLELGSGLGVVSTVAFKTGKVKELHCFEADPRLIDLIRHTHEANQVVGSQVNNVILTSDPELLERGTVTFHQRTHFWGSSTTLEHGRRVLNSVEVPTRSFSDALRSIRPTVIICDIEGGERDLFRGADLSGVKRIALETHQSVLGGKGMQLLFKDLHEAGFHYDQRYSQRSVVVFSSTTLVVS